jgi:hypothetical protein
MVMLKSEDRKPLDVLLRFMQNGKPDCVSPFENVVAPIKKRANTACSNCLECQGSCCFLFGWKGKELHAERLLITRHRIEDGKELSHTSSERHLLEFASFQ